MSEIKQSALELIGNTPILKLNNYAKNCEANIFAKLELFNPAGSAKDRVAYKMILDAESKGILKPGATIIEPTSGNTGIGLASVAAAKGYKAVLVLPDTMSKERITMLKAYGAEVVLTPGAEGMKGSIAKAEEIHSTTPGSMILGQFENPSNPAAHEETTGPEIWKQTDGKVDIFIAGIGTGGTITGTGRYLKSKNSAIKIIGVEPESSPMITKGISGPHAIQGIGANFIPENYDPKIVDEVLPIKNEDCFVEGREFAHTEGLIVGISSGAVLKAAKLIAGRQENKGKNIVVLLPDSGDRYLSTKLFED